MSDFKYIVPPNEPRIVKEISDVGIAPSVPLNISNSALFLGAGSSSDLRRTINSVGNRRTWTFSCWVKRAKLGASTPLFYAGGNNTNDTYGAFFDTDDTLVSGFYTASAWTWQHRSSALFRDVSAWYHIVVSWDTTNTIDSEKIKMYVNGNRIVNFGTQTFPALNFAGEINNITYANLIGRNAVPNISDAYIAEVNFIDGQVLTPSNFGRLSNRTNSWIPTRYIGSYTGNSFYLNFNNASNMGLDSSGLNNNFNFAPGNAFPDRVFDTPTNNFCTLNTLDKYSSITISNGNLYGSLSGQINGGGGMRGSIGVSFGKWYWEVTAGTVPSARPYLYIGVDKTTEGNVSALNNVGTGSLASSYIYFPSYKQNSGSSSLYGASFTTGDIIGVALDLDSGNLTFYKNGVSQGIAFSGLSGNFSPSFGLYTDAASSPMSMNFNVNFGQKAFTFSPPSGFKSLCTSNLSIPTIRKPNQFFDTVIYTGNGSIQNISLNFNPDFIWQKSRSVARSHRLQDSVRGFNRVLVSDTTAVEYSGSSIDSTNSGGIVLNASDNQNNNAETYVSWNWCAGSSTIVSAPGSTVRANPTAGFSIATYTGNGVSNNIIHNLGVSPSMVIIKSLSGSRNWYVYHQGVDTTPTASEFYHLNFNNPNGRTLGAQNWIGRNSSSINVGLYTDVVASGERYIAYLWSEIEGYSRFGRYTGNGLADGPFVLCGFRPRWVMIKRTDSASAVGWFLWDTARGSSSNGNVIGYQLYPNSSTSESSSSIDLDILSSGFKLRALYQDYNASSGTYIFAAFAEYPFKYANAR